MTTLFTVDFENNKLYDPSAKGFDFIACSGGTMEVTTGSKYEGTYGCAVTPLQYYKVIGAMRVHSLTRFRQQFYIHPNGVTIPTTRSVLIARNYHNDNSNGYYRLYLQYTSGTGYQIVSNCASNVDDQAWSSSAWTLDNQTGWNRIQTDFYANDASGFWKVWMNQSSVWTNVWNRTTVNGNLRVKYPCIGAALQNYAISGSFFLDYWIGNDDGSEIGA